MRNRTVIYGSRTITLLPDNVIVRLQVDDPHFGVLEVSEFQRSSREVQKYKKGDFFNYEGKTYTISIEPVLLDLKSYIDTTSFYYQFFIVTVAHPLFKQSAE